MAFRKAKHLIDVPCAITELQSQELYAEDLYLEAADRLIRQGLSSTPNAAAGVAAQKLARGYQVERLTLTDVQVDIAAADDYGSVKLVDLPDSNVLILGAIMNCTAVADGTAITDVTTVDYAIGTAALASTDFSGSGEKDICPEKDVAASGVSQNATTGTEANNLVAKGTNAVYLNAQAAISADGWVQFTGTIDLIFVDLGAES